MLKKASTFVLGRSSGSGRLINSAARTNVALLIRRAVRPWDVSLYESAAEFLRPSHGKGRVLARQGRVGVKAAFLSVLRTGAVLLPLALTALSDGLAQTGSIAHDPTDMVDKYLELDIKGVRLDAISQEALAPYVTWSDEPVWGRAVIVTKYEVINEFKQWTVISQAEVIIPVEYTVLGSVYWERAAFLPEPKAERVGFRVKIVGDRWRIAEPMLPPHVGQKRMINYVRQAILDEKEPSKITVLETLLEDLKKAKHEGPASAQAPR
jgi:hypothetical protein